MFLQPRLFKNAEEETHALHMMDHYGGSFVVGLSSLYRKADPVNKARLRMVFWEYFGKYAKMKE